ncbi:MAG: hypothetical protein PHR43_07785 [Dehalococcoidales bacterium]|nr:hypothetical protein [Dehalococcoidales bacterium]
MSIEERLFPKIWQALGKWLKQKSLSLDALAKFTGKSRERIQNGIRNGTEWIDSKFIHDCIEFFGFQFRRGTEDFDDVLSDEECIDLLTSILEDEQFNSDLE